MPPTTSILCLRDFDPSGLDTMRQDARIRSEPAWGYRELPIDHFIPWTNPRQLADVFCELV